MIISEGPAGSSSLRLLLVIAAEDFGLGPACLPHDLSHHGIGTFVSPRLSLPLNLRCHLSHASAKALLLSSVSLRFAQSPVTEPYRVTHVHLNIHHVLLVVSQTLHDMLEVRHCISARLSARNYTVQHVDLVVALLVKECVPAALLGRYWR